jgi:hypothetical protein
MIKLELWQYVSPYHITGWSITRPHPFYADDWNFQDIIWQALLSEKARLKIKRG